MNYSMSVRRNTGKPKYSSLAFVQAVFVPAILVFLLISSIAAKAWSADTDKLIIDLDSAQLGILRNSGLKDNIVLFGGIFRLGTFPTNTNSWEVEQYTPTQYHLRNKLWGDFFWNINLEQNKIWRMNGSDLKADGSDAKLLADVSVKVQKGPHFENGSLVYSKENAPRLLNSSDAKGDQKYEPGTDPANVISLKISSAQLILDQQTDTVRVVAGGVILSDFDSWEVRHIVKNVYHVRLKSAPMSFWEINTTSMTMDLISGGNFGFPGGYHTHLYAVMHIGDPDSSPPKREIPVDLGMARYRENNPKSAWQESEKALNESVLRKSSYDVLIVPFQVGGYAIDRADRSLMTRYLVQSFETLTNLKLPSPTLVSRALGEASRTFDEYDVFQLANKLGVKQIIRGYVGHDLHERMSVTLVVQTRSGQEYFSPSTKAEKYTLTDIAISDERTPADAFLSVLPEMLEKLQFAQNKHRSNQPDDFKGKITLPAGIRGLVADGSSSPLIRAYYLQLLGMLYPEQSVSKEQLFERSLVVLRELPPQSYTYKVLKARALFYLYRRPAAVAVLSTPKGAEEKALAAFIDGNLQLLNKSIKDINEPLPRLIAQIELSDLLWSYNQDRARTVSIDSMINAYPDWAMILTRRLHHQDGWNVQSNFEVKKELDQLFPISGFTAEDIVKSKMAVGELQEEDDDVDFSVYNHYRRIMENQPEMLTMNESTGIVDRDVLDLMVAFGESNLLKKIRLRHMQGLYDEMTKLVDHYNVIYAGRPEMAFLKALALYRIADSKQGQAQKNLREEAYQLQSDVCYWSQGQTKVSYQRSCFGKNMYDADYPRRWYWQFSNDSRDLTDRIYRGPQESTRQGNLEITRFDRKQLMNYDLALQYTQTDFSILSNYYEKLRALKMNDEAAALLEKNRNRFIGNSGRTSFFAQIAERDGDVKRAKSIYEEGIAFQPYDWNAYEGLSLLLMRQGENKEASKTALKYPLFSISKQESENPSIDTVSLSNHAYDIGGKLWWNGTVDEAKPLLSLAAEYNTGSGAEMWSTIFLATLERDFTKAAQISLENAKRYNQTSAYGSYMEFLHVMGYHDEAWSVLKQSEGRSYGEMNWSPVIIGHRMEGKTQDEQIQWLLNLPLSELTSQSTPIFPFLVYTLDRETDINLATQLQAVKEQIESLKNRSQPLISQIPQRDSIPMALKNTPGYQAFLKTNGDPIIPLADGYALLKKHRFTEAYEKLKVKFLGGWIRKDMFSFSIPYLSWSAAKSGGVADIEPYLSEYKKELGDDFDYYLSMSFLAGSKNDHREATKNLNAARYHMRNLNGMRLLPGWYQLAEACEWLYEDSKFEGYRDLLLEFVKRYQIIRPMDAWAYAFEAKYTKSDADRIRALAITLYLDKQSERIAHLSNEQKSKALEWLKDNNPFSLNQNKSQQKDI
jgi:hypothetical protein